MFVALRLIARKAYARRDYARAKKLLYMEKKVRLGARSLDQMARAIGIYAVVMKHVVYDYVDIEDVI